MPNQMLTDIQVFLRNDTTSNWSMANPILGKGEVGVETDTHRIKFGDGLTPWVALRYVGTEVITMNTDPTSSDVGFDIGSFWMNSTANKMFILSRKNGNQAIWVKLITSTDLTTALMDVMRTEVYHSSTTPTGYVDNALHAKVTDKLSTAREMSVYGDVSSVAPAVFDGSKDIAFNVVLKDIISSGTGCKLTIDSKGRVVGYSALTVDDVPIIPTTKVSGLGTAAKEDTGITPGSVVVVGLDGKIDERIMPPLAVMDTHVVESINAMLALDAQKGDIAILDNDIDSKTYILKQIPANVLTNWIELKSPTAKVTSINGRTGAVVLSTDEIDEGYNNKYFTKDRVNQVIDETLPLKSIRQLRDGHKAVLTSDTIVINCGNAGGPTGAPSTETDCIGFKGDSLTDILITSNKINCFGLAGNISPTFILVDDATYKLYSNAACTINVNTFNLTAGVNTYYLRVTAEDGVTVKDYTITITVLSTDCSIASMSGGNNVVISGTNITCSWTEETPLIPNIVATNPNAKVEYFMGYTEAGSILYDKVSAVRIVVGRNTFYVRVTAADHKTIKVYTVVVTGTPSSISPPLNTDCKLTAFSFNGIFESNFDASLNNPVINCKSRNAGNIVATHKLAISVSPRSSYLLYSDESCLNKITDVNLLEGNNAFYVQVVAEDITRTSAYTINAYVPTSETLLTNIAGGVLEPGTFKRDAGGAKTATIEATQGTMQAAAFVYDLPVGATAAICAANGAPASSVAFTPGANIFYVKVVADNDSTTVIYAITATVKYTTTTPTALTINGVTVVTPPTRTGNTYNAVTKKGNATVNLDFGAATAKTTSIICSDPEMTLVLPDNIALTPGEHNMYIKVTAEDKVATASYILHVYVQSDNTELFGMGGTGISNLVSEGNLIRCNGLLGTVTPTIKTADSKAVAKIHTIPGGAAVTSLTLQYGDNDYVIQVVAEDGSVYQYDLTIYVKQIGNSLLTLTGVGITNTNINATSHTVTANAAPGTITPMITVSDKATYIITCNAVATTQIVVPATGVVSCVITVTAENGTNQAWNLVLTAKSNA